MILGVPVPGAHALVDGAHWPLRELGEQGAVLAGRDQPVPLDQLGEVLVALHEDPAPVRPEFPAPASYGEFPDRAEQQRDLEWALREAVVAGLPDGWQRVVVDCAALGTRIEITATTDAEHRWIPTQDVVDALRRHRDITYRPDTGAWTTARLQLDQDGADLSTGHDEPSWLIGPEDGRAHYEELRYYPRTTAPGWLLNPAWEHYGQHRESARPAPVRMAQVFDGRDADGRPLVHRPALTSVEKRLVAHYLHGGEILLRAYSSDPDELDPQRPPAVPKQFHTDGTWVWPLALAYYLDEHDVAPPREFLDHIRGRNHQPPGQVADRAAAEAKALVLGGDPDALQQYDPAEAIDIARGFISAMGMSTRFYSFEEPLEGGWSMLRGSDGWWVVFCVDEGEVRNRSTFPDPYAAAAHLIGAMSLTRKRFLREPDEPLQDFECRYEPFPGEPPLAAYDNKLLVTLRTGDEVDRFGEPTGNTVFVAGTTLPQRSVPPQQQPGEYHRYRVVSGFEVISGVAKPDFGQVGGGTAFVLPNDVRTLVADGWLVEV
ncbi:TNT domain-containing protein [Saccharopolyspora sp. NPDC000359]|uniref:TNT domain-containing protein n=1 Tax=Saccharopolyspora sp. NPDC000359 TaxID=3154251 RepID=UPI00331F5DA2